MGVIRTTFAMIAASIIRRKQILKAGLPDPFGMGPREEESKTISVCIVIYLAAAWLIVQQPSQSIIQQSLEQANQQLELSRSLLRLNSLLQRSLNLVSSPRSISCLSRPFRKRFLFYNAGATRKSRFIGLSEKSTPRQFFNHSKSSWLPQPGLCCEKIGRQGY
jgi:hypothetical protein